MPLLKEFRTETYAVFVWKVTETYDELLTFLSRSDMFRNEAERRFTSMKRRLEFVAVRVLLYAGAGLDHPEVGYLETGKPFLLHDARELSISHTQGYVAVMLAEKGVPGIDIERRTDRVVKLKDRIVGPEEQAETPDELLLHWSAKETAYKMMSCREVDWVNHLRLSMPYGRPYPMNIRIGQTGEMTLSTFHPDCMTTFTVNYLFTDDFVLTYSVAFLEKAHQDYLCDNDTAEHR